MLDSQEKCHEEAVDDRLNSCSVIDIDSLSPRVSAFRSECCKVKQSL